MRILNFIKTNNNKHKSVRVKTNIGDKYLNVNLDQTYESLDILSLKIFQKDIYRLFDADYGIIVGRVLGQGVGIPNARVSVFIPLDETNQSAPTTLDDLKTIETIAMYPYKTVYDLDGNGKIFNLLPKYSKNRNFNGFPDNEFGIGATPKTPVGNFPEKEEILVNETLAYVYDKYLKFTTVTNESGDYILTVPSNRTFNINMSCDITDIGKFSTCAALLKLDGYPDSLFTEDGTKINEDIPLEKLPNIEIQNQSLNVKPLWSQNSSNTNVGINRLDFNLNKKIKPFTTIIGNHITQNSKSWWGDKVQFRFVIGIRALCIDIDFTIPIIDVRIFYRIKIPGIIPFIRVALFVRKMCTINGGKGDYEPYEFRFVDASNLCSIDEAFKKLTEGINDSMFVNTHVKGDLDIKLFNIKNNVTENDAENINKTENNNDSLFSKYSHETDIELYDKSKYITYQNNGNFLVLLNCNRNKVITNENGDLIPVADDSDKGVFTSFRGYFYLTNLSDVDNPPTRYRVGKVRLKIPQSFDYDQSNSTNRWIWKHYKFDFGKIYSVAQLSVIKEPNKTSEGEAKEDYASYSDTTGFASQTNLVLFGDTVTNNIGDTPIPYQNQDLPNYNNFYNHLVNLGADEQTITEPFTANTASSDVNSGGQIFVKPLDINIYNPDINNINAQTRRRGFNITNTGTTYNLSEGLKFIFEISLNEEFINNEDDIWSVGILITDKTNNNSILNAYTATTSQPNRYLSDFPSIQPYARTQDQTTGTRFRYFELTIPKAQLENNWFGYFNILKDTYPSAVKPYTIGFTLNNPPNYNWRNAYFRVEIQCVLAGGVNDESFFNKTFYITNSNDFDSGDNDLRGLFNPYIFGSRTYQSTDFIKIP